MTRYELFDLYPEDADDIYGEIITDHRDMTIEALTRRIARCTVIGRDAITYGISRANLARRVGAHAQQTLLAKAQKRVAA